MPRVPPFDRPATYDDLVALDEIYIAEIVSGELYGTRRLPPRHSTASTKLGIELRAAESVQARLPNAWWILRCVEIHLGDNVVVPDWSAWRRDRLPTISDLAYMPLAPDWACEVLTPETVMLDRVKKLAIYAREGVGIVWLLDPPAQTLEVLRLENGRWTILATHAGEEIVRAEPFIEVAIGLQDLWVT